MNNLLLTGANNPLGRLACRGLASQFSLTAVDDEPGQNLPGVRTLTGDLRSRDFTAKALENQAMVIHLAPLSLPQRSTSPVEENDFVDRAAFGTFNLLTLAVEQGIPSVVVGSTLDLFSLFPDHWFVSEAWVPRPEPVLQHLCPWLAERSAYEISLSGAAAGQATSVTCLRFGRLVTGVEQNPPDARWLTEEDALQGITWALEQATPGWRVYHLTSTGRFTRLVHAGGRANEQQNHPVDHFHQRQTEPAQPADGRKERTLAEVLVRRQENALPTKERPVRKVVIFGAGGPLGVSLYDILKGKYTVRLADVRTLEEVLAATVHANQAPDAPTLQSAPEPPDEWLQVDIRDPEAVAAACEGMDAILNCSVLRWDPVLAFQVNMLGALNIARAAVQHNIRRLVQTGPQQFTLDSPLFYGTSEQISDDVPARPGRSLYAHTKYLGQEILRVFAETYLLEVPVLLFDGLVQPNRPRWVEPMAVSWRDAAQAVRSALEVPALPSPYEVFNILTDLPHGRYSSRKAQTILGWQPEDHLERLWQDMGED